MYSTIKKMAILSTLLLSVDAFAEERISFGLGIGASYSGFGFNVSQLSENDMKYISAGCVHYSSIYGSNCGAGIGWIKTDLIKTDSNKHGLGAYIGILGVESEGTGFNYEKNSKYGVSVGYHYFLNGINKTGSNVGVTLANGHSLLFQWGYQF